MYNITRTYWAYLNPDRYHHPIHFCPEAFVGSCFKGGIVLVQYNYVLDLVSQIGRWHNYHGHLYSVISLHIQSLKQLEKYVVDYDI